MEYLLSGNITRLTVGKSYNSLNPYCYGIPSQRTLENMSNIQLYECLNPYCYGIPSQR